MGRTPQAVATALLLLLPGVSAAQSVNMGNTFHGLEARATRVTATFPDVIVEVRRAGDATIEAELKPRGGGAAASLRVGADRRVQWTSARPGRVVREFALPDQTTISLDWAAFQLHALHVDEAAAGDETLDVTGDTGAWDGHLRRSRRALSRGASSGQLASRLESVETSFGELVVRAALDQHTRPTRPGKRVDYSKFTATIVDARTGARRGFVRWFDTAQVLTWKIEGGSQGVVMPDRLPGGWTFTPTMAWANVQAYQFVTQAASTLEAAGPMAAAWRNLLTRPRHASPVATLAWAVAPLPIGALSASAVFGGPALSDMPVLGRLWDRPARATATGGTVVNEPGCDNLHWLDGTVFRVCCDQHDRCYETNGCNSGSWWWPFSGSWSCERCNVAVVYCFCTLSNPAYCGGGLIGEGDRGSGSGSGSCTAPAGGFCPVDCQSCQAP